MTPAQPHKHLLRSDNKGYTLIEIITVIVLIGIVALAFIRPVIFSMMDTSNLEASKLQLKSDITNLKIDSMRHLLKHKIVFTPGSDTYDMYVQHNRRNRWVDLPSGYQLPAGVTIISTTLPDHELVFDSLGIPYEDTSRPRGVTDEITATRSIILEAGNGSQSQIFIIPETGYISAE